MQKTKATLAKSAMRGSGDLRTMRNFNEILYILKED